MLVGQLRLADPYLDPSHHTHTHDVHRLPAASSASTMMDTWDVCVQHAGASWRGVVVLRCTRDQTLVMPFGGLAALASAQPEVAT